MRGPVVAPAGAEPGRYFVCDRCNFTLRDRRRRSRPAVPEAPPARW
jgi:hypothetical protein